MELLLETENRLKELTIEMVQAERVPIVPKFYDVMRKHFVRAKLHKVIKIVKTYGELKRQLFIQASSDRGYAYQDKDHANKTRNYRWGFINCFVELVEDDINRRNK